jgi:hypothetical protein
MADPTQPSAVDMSDGTILQSAFGPQAASESLALLNLHPAAITDQAKRQVLATLQHVLWTLRQDAGAYVDSVGWSVVQTAATHADAEVARSAQSVLAIAAQQAQGALQEEVNKIMTLIQNTQHTSRVASVLTKRAGATRSATRVAQDRQTKRSDHHVHLVSSDALLSNHTPTPPALAYRTWFGADTGGSHGCFIGA